MTQGPQKPSPRVQAGPDLTRAANPDSGTPDPEAFHRYRLLFERAGDIILFMDDHGRLIDANDAAVRSYGYTREELLSLSIHDLRLSQDAPLVQEQMEKAATGGILFETMHRRKDGTTFPVEVSSQGVVESSRRTLLSVVRDITSRKRAERERELLLEEMGLQAAELDAIFQALTNGVVVYDAGGAPVRANPAAIQSYGIDPVGVDRAELARRLSIRHLNGSIVSPDELASTRALRGEVVEGEVYRFTNAQGEEFIIVASGSPLIVDGERSGAVIVWQDLTERERLLGDIEELADTASRRAAELRSILDNMVDAVVVSDAQGLITLVNESAVRLLGLPSEEDIRRVGTLFQELNLRHLDGRPFAPEELPTVRALMGEVVALDDGALRNPNTQKDVYIRVSAAPIRNGQGNIDGAVVVARDVTALTELDRLKDQFISVAAHELKTPVAIMKGYAQLLQRKAPDLAPERRGMLDAIDRGADRIDRIVNDLLDISRLHAGYLELSPEKVDLAKLVWQAMGRMQLGTGQHRVRVVKADHAVVNGDPDRLEQVLINLIDNAIRYSPRGGDVDVAVLAEADRAVVSVTDRGVGIPRDKQDHIFEHFFRAHTGTPYDYGGMGVGLYISREIVTRHGGEIGFESEEGWGSRFYFNIPLASG